jgi:hypothetical protein
MELSGQLKVRASLYWEKPGVTKLHKRFGGAHKPFKSGEEKISSSCREFDSESP